MTQPSAEVPEVECPPGPARLCPVRGTREPAGGSGRCGAPRRNLRPSRTLFAYLARGLLVNSGLAFLVLEAVQGIIFTVRATEGFSFDILLIFPVLLRAFAQAVTYTLPLALLFGTGLLAGRLNADREVLSMRSFGVSPLELLMPAGALGGVLAMGAYHFNTEWSPAMRFANRDAESLILDRLGYLGEGWNLPILTRAEMTIWIHHYDGPVLEGIFVSKGWKGGGILVSEDILKKVDAPSYPLYFFAERGIVARGTGRNAGKLVLELRGVSLFFDDDLVNLIGAKQREADAAPPSEGRDPRERREKKEGLSSSNFMQRLRIDAITWPIEIPRKDPTVKDMTAAELREGTDLRFERLRNEEKSGNPEDLKYAKAQYWYAVTEFHRRLALSLCVLSFPLCALALGLFVTSSNRLLPFFIATTLVPSLYFLSEMFGNNLARKGILPWATQELGNLAVGLFTLALLLRLYRGPRRSGWAVLVSRSLAGLARVGWIRRGPRR